MPCLRGAERAHAFSRCVTLNEQPCCTPRARVLACTLLCISSSRSSGPFVCPCVFALLRLHYACHAPARAALHCLCALQQHATAALSSGTSTRCPQRSGTGARWHYVRRCHYPSQGWRRPALPQHREPAAAGGARPGTCTRAAMAAGAQPAAAHLLSQHSALIHAAITVYPWPFYLLVRCA